MEPLEWIAFAAIMFGVSIVDRWAKKAAKSNNLILSALGHDVDDACEEAETATVRKKKTLAP
jgi:hypothetical protein